VARTTILTTLRTLREPRYAALSALMVLVALICVGAGTWQIVRFVDKVRANDALTTNAHAAAASVAQVLPLVGRPGPSADSVRYRLVTATGHYDDTNRSFVRLRTVNGTDGSLVLTPFVTNDGVLLVVRGLYHTGPDTNPPPPSAPQGTYTIKARVQTSETDRDSAAEVAKGQVLSINAPAQAARLHEKVFDGYAQLLGRQPGTKGLISIPPPSLSNPAGGAVEPQHFAYIVQWYLFALLALAAPFAMVRADRKEREATGVPDRSAQAAPLTEAQRRAAKLADRYGRAGR
jgi:cytochrome oxidase assembly protein ShyY1